ncbi:MAG: xanthine dehydrogenase family protein molybdopterin-binding subunit, partial [Edaphobacter sp.]
MIAPQEQKAAKLDSRQLAHRYDALAKVTGRAKYAAEFPVKDVAYAYVVQATIPSGIIVSIDQAAAARAAGVYSIITPFNAPKLAVPGSVNILRDTT